MTTRAQYWKEQIGVARAFAPYTPMEAVARVRTIEAQIREVLQDVSEEEERAELVSILRYCLRTLHLYERQLADWQSATEQRARHFNAEEMAALTTPIPHKV
jgi:hypothetical protein